MAGEKLLTDAQCKAAKPKEKIYYLNDGSGLRLRVSPNGEKNKENLKLLMDELRAD